LVESSEQPEPERIENLGDDIFTSSFEQSDTQRIDVSNALANQSRRSSNQADHQTKQPTEVGFFISCFLHLSHSLTLCLFLQDSVHESSGDLQQDFSDQS
jgi:hypothetical protein